jgi:plastocyanin
MRDRRHARRRLWLGLAATLAAATLALPAMAAEPTIEATAVNTWSPNTSAVSSGGAIKIVNTSMTNLHGVEWKSGPNTPSCTSGVPVGNTPSASGTNWSGSCTFTQAGTYVFWCTVHGSSMSETVTVSAGALVIETTTLPEATRGGAYTATLTASGGVPPYKWKKVGPLPKGLKLLKTGMITGTPSTKLAAGSYPIGVKVTDSKKKGKDTATAALTLKVN